MSLQACNCYMLYTNHAV
uniref:Uncharacterized protein n=1 Tax=Amphimedon queenslandica TaxID=400682 RepID=A0A1X7V3L3_AMPQE